MSDWHGIPEDDPKRASELRAWQTHDETETRLALGHDYGDRLIVRPMRGLSREQEQRQLFEKLDAWWSEQIEFPECGDCRNLMPCDCKPGEA